MARHVPCSGPVAGKRSGRRWIVRRYRVTFMAKKTQRGDETSPSLSRSASFGRYAGPATLILSSLAEGPSTATP